MRADRWAVNRIALSGVFASAARYSTNSADVLTGPFKIRNRAP
jgi:hypothetical protein